MDDITEVTAIMDIVMSVLAILIVIGGIAAVILAFINEKKSVKEWLLLAVTEAEKQYGTKTGRLKLRAAYESFVKLFPVFSKFVTFETFSLWVDVTLKEMRNLIYANNNVRDYVAENGTENK